MKVLIVKTSSMGDVIHTFPAVTDALDKRRDIALDWCVEEPFAAIAALHPGIGHIHRVALRDWRRTPFSRNTRTAISMVRTQMREARYDLVIDAQGLLKSVFLARMAAAPVAGFDRKSARESVSALFYQERFAVARNLHAITRTRLLFGAALGYEPNLDRLDNGICPPPAQTARYGERTVFLLHGTSRESKKWPVESWIALASTLAAKGLTPVTTWSNPAERAVAEAIALGEPQTVVIDKSPLMDIAAEIGRAALVVGTDTGLMHLASAFALPTIAIFLTTQPGLTGPLGYKSLVVEKEPSGTVTPERVAVAAAQMLEIRPEPSETS